ncbi:hypothetical protein MKW98_012103 [Papaver atlanticum]|uniref:Bifunctional inhibitor/plant lipid transfer protein/seed storage helical domain-containing protein n=1 Tax=Papaver atlanticum TaxID=357466 RepID=A0AAD4TEN1_9MAGN|nr:hypothetical protein MKW98_012103 [Papaver atlanticum]
MAGIKKSSVPSLYYTSAALFLIFMTLGAEIKSVQSQQSCLQDISNLSVCAQFVLPGQGVATPCAECCSALQRVDSSCICNTFRIAARIPSACSLPSLTCGD